MTAEEMAGLSADAPSLPFQVSCSVHMLDFETCCRACSPVGVVVAAVGVGVAWVQPKVLASPADTKEVAETNALDRFFKKYNKVRKTFGWSNICVNLAIGPPTHTLG